MATPACELPGTGGSIVEMEWQAASSMTSPTVLTSGAEPWEVELVEAKVLIGPIYAFGPGPQASRRGLFNALFGAGRAFAHAGDDNTLSAPVVAELLDQVSIDLLAPGTVDLGPSVAAAGPVDALNVVLDEARFDLAGEDGPTRGNHAWLRGVARRDGTEVRFAMGLSEATIPDDRIARRIESLPVGGEAALDGGSVLRIGIDPTRWVRSMRFETLLGEGGTAPAEEVQVPEPSQLHNAWYIAMRNPGGWSATAASSQ